MVRMSDLLEIQPGGKGVVGLVDIRLRKNPFVPVNSWQGHPVEKPLNAQH